jgi:hypothetical protein
VRINHHEGLAVRYVVRLLPVLLAAVALHFTLTAVGIDPHKLNQTPVSRTVHFSEGEPIAALLGKR